MCTGIEIALMAAAAGASAAGNAIQQKRNNDSNNAMINARNNAAARGVAQQQPRIQEAQEGMKETVNRFDIKNQEADQNDVATARTKVLRDSVTPAGAEESGARTVANAPKIVQDTLAARMAAATQFSNDQAGALGRLGSSNELFARNGITLGNNASNLNYINDISKGDARVNRMEQNSAANNARKSPSMFGQLLSTAGNVGMSAASKGAGGGEGSSAGASPYTAAGGLDPVYGRVDVYDLPPIKGA